MTAFWWVVALTACIGLYFAIRFVAAKRGEHEEISSEVSAEIARRADQQDRWAQRGDARGVYGVEGAELMRRVDPEPNIDAELEKATEYPRTAAVAYTTEDLDKLLAEKLPCWRWAAFASVLVQRRAKVQSRLRDDQLGYGAPIGEHAGSGAEVGRFVVDRMDELLVLVEQVESFMLTPAFVGVFGDPGNESGADAEGIVHTASRLMDYHEKFLALAERCRGLAMPSHYKGLLRDLAQLMDVPLAGYRTFIDDFVERVGEMPEMLHYARGTVELTPSCCTWTSTTRSLRELPSSSARLQPTRCVTCCGGGVGVACESCLVLVDPGAAGVRRRSAARRRMGTAYWPRRRALYRHRTIPAANHLCRRRRQDSPSSTPAPTAPLRPNQRGLGPCRDADWRISSRVMHASSAEDVAIPPNRGGMHYEE